MLDTAAFQDALANIPARVKEGETWLPTLDPNWRTTVDPTTLAMDDNERCVLGQIALSKGFAGENAAINMLGSIGVSASWDDDEFEVSHGFTAPRQCSAVQEREYFARLREEWTHRLAAAGA